MNKFPDKILLTQDTETGNLHDEWVLRNLTQCKDMEYIRKDIFIDKVCEWLKFYYTEFLDNSRLGINIGEMVKDFKSDMKGE